MPRKSPLFCPLSMKNNSQSARNHHGVSHSWRFTLFVLGLLLCFFAPDYVEAVFTPPAGCTSSTWIYQNNKVQNISCRGQNLLSVPTDAKEGSDVIRLDLADNLISNLSNNEFQYFTNLLDLDLSNNKISVFDLDTFTNLTNLQFLNLAGNNLSTLPSGTFTSISVTTLDLSSINLQSVDRDHFKNLVNLEELYLSHNNLSILEQHLFKDLQSLRLIDLSHNVITYVDKDFLNDANSLTNLDLSNNRIASLDKSTFNDLKYLEILYLNDNLLTSLDTDIFKELTSLTTLHLTTNLLTTLNRDVFKELDSLTSLYLGNNAQTTVHKDLFQHNSNLQDLSLSANQLSTIPTDIFDHQTTFQVDLSGNPFICSCDIRDFLFSLKYSTSISLIDEGAILCTDASLQQHINLDYDNANCSGNLGAACTVTYDCKVRNAQCSNSKCICPANFYDTNLNTTNGGLCYAKVDLDHECPGMDTACMGSHVECAVKSPSSANTYCLCESAYYDDNPQYVGGTCRLKVELGQPCTSINNMCRPDYSLCGTSDTCECQTGYYDNDGTLNIGGDCLQVLALYSSCNQSYQCGPANSECTNSACSCMPGYYDFTNIGQCKGPSGFYSCYPDNTSSVEVVFDKVNIVSTEEECKNYCFVENVRYYLVEGSNICICGNTTTSKSCCPKISDQCSSRSYLGPITTLAEAGIRMSHIPRLVEGKSHEVSVTTSLTAIDQINLRFGDSQTIKTVNASSVTTQHTYTHSGLFWLTVSACAATRNVCEDASLPIRVQVPAVNLTTYMTAITLADVSSNLSSSFSATFSMGYDIDYRWSKTYGGTVTKRKSCKPGWTQHRNKCIKLMTSPTSYSTAKTTCAADGSLLKISFMQELTEIVTALSASSETLLIGAERAGGVWQWSDGSKTVFFDDDLVSSTNGDCVALVGSSSTLTSISCTTSTKYVCMSDPVDCPKGGDLLSNDYCYVLASTESVSAKNWNAANQYCASYFGGWLTNVTDAAVQSKVTSLLTSHSVSEAWIGLSDQQVEGSYLWGDFSSFDFNSASYLPTVTSNSGDCFVATSANTWNSQDCTNIRDFVCQYSERIERLTVPSFVSGTADLDITPGQDIQQAVAASTFPSAATSSLEILIFPGLPFARSGTIRQVNFRSVNVVSGNYDVSFQIYRPSCTTGYLYQAGCVPTMFSSCVAGTYSCTPNTGCSDSEYFCLLSNSCVFKNESCTCNSVSVPTTTSGCGSPGSVSNYELITQLSVTFSNTGERWYGVTGELAVQEGDIIGLQYPTGKNIVNCENRPSSLDQQKVMKGTTSNWLVKKDSFPATATTEDLTCDMQFVYTQDLAKNLPNNLGYMDTVGNYQLAISIIETETKTVSISLEESVADVELVYPVLGLTNTSLTSLGAVYTEWNVAYHFTIAAGRGTNLSLKCALLTGQTFTFTSSCHSSVSSEVGDNCNSSMWWSDTPFATFTYNTSAVGTISTTIEVSNSLSAQSYTLYIITEKRITGVVFSLKTPSRLPNCIRKGTTAQFDLENTEGTNPSYSFKVAGVSAASRNASLFYSFPTIGTFTVAGTISNNLDSQTKSINVSVKQEASFTNCKLLDTPYIAAVGISFDLKLQCECSIGSEVNTHWMFSDSTANITTADVTVSSSPKSWTQAVTFSSVSTVDLAVYAMDAFQAVLVNGSVNVYNAIPTITVTANSSNVFLNTVVEITVNVPTSPGNYYNINYSYDFGDGSTKTSASSVVTHSFTTGNNYTVSVTASNGPSSQTASMNIVVYEAVTVTALTNDGPKQTGNPITFTASVSSGNFLSYRYVSSNSAFDVTRSTGTYTHTFASAGNYSVTVTVSNMLSTQSVSTQAYVMNAGDLIISGFKIDGNDVSGCYESTIGRSYKVDLIHYSVATIVCDWNFGDGQTYTGTTCHKTHAFTTASNFTITVTAKYHLHSATETLSQQVCIQERITTPTMSIESTVTLPSSGSVKRNVTVAVATGSPLTYAWLTNATGTTSTDAILPVEFTSEGTYYFTVTVSNNVNSETVTKSVTVIEELSGVTIVCSSCLEISGEYYIQNNVATEFKVTTTTGSGSFAWDFGDSTTGTGISNFHTYTSIDTYNVTVTASSMVTTAVTQYITVHVEAAITSVTMQNRLYDWLTNKRDSSVKDLNILNTGRFDATVTPAGMDLDYIWKCESGTIEETTQVNEWDHKFPTKGSKSCTVTVKNSLGNMTSSAFTFFVVEKLLGSSLQVTENGNALTGTNETHTYKAKLNEVITFTVTSSQIVPNTVEYFLRLKKKSTGSSIYALQNSTIDKDDPTLSYRLDENALYQLEAIVTNSLGPVSITVYVEVVEAVSGPYINPAPGKDGNITLGSSITLTGGATNGEYKEFNWLYASAPSGQVLPTTTTSDIVITPSVVGLYIVTLEVSNAVSGPISVNYTINVMIGVSGVQISVTMPYTNAVRVYTSLTFTAQIAAGTSPSYSWNALVSGTTNSTGTAQTFVYQFMSQALYNITLFAENYASSGTAYKEIYSLYDVPTFTLSMSGASYITSISKHAAPSNTIITFSSSITNTEYMQFNWNIGGTSVAATETLQKNFTSAAEYTVQLTASNLISNENSQISILVQDSISDFDVQNCIGTYMMNTVITLTSSYKGTDISVDWTRQGLASVTSAATTVQYSTVGIYSVNVTGRNYVSQETKNCWISIQGPIGNLNLQASVYKYVGYPITFNVSGDYINPAIFTWVFSHGVNMTTSNSPTLDLSFTTSGNYTLTVIVANDVSSSRKSISFQVKDLGCSAPTVTVVGSTDKRSPRAREVEISVDVSTGGCSSYSSSNSWKVYSASSCVASLQNEYTLPSTIKTDLPSIVLLSNTLNYGTYCVVFQHTYENTPVEAFKYFNLTIVPSDLVSVLSGGHKVGVRVASTLSLDASQSYDPDNVPATTLNFAWSCTQTMGSSAAAAVCNGISAITNASTILTGLTLTVNDVYVVTVTVSATGRIASSFTQTITILSNTAPVISINCVSCQANGHYFLTRSRSVSFEGACIGCNTASLQWTVKENSTGTADTIDSTKTTTDTNQMNFVLLSGVIQDNKAYVFKLEATVGSETGQAEIVLAPSSKPSGGICTLSPSAGVVALTDTATYSCSNVVDSDSLSAIYYKVTVRSTTSYKTPYIAYYGSKSVNSIFVVPFPGTNYSSVQIEISAVNFYRAETVLYTRTVSFVAPTLSSSQAHKTDYIVDQMLSNMKTIVRQNNPPLLLQYCMSVLSYLNDQSENNVGTLAQRMAIRDVIMNSLSGLPLTSIYNIQQMATAIEYLVEHTEEVSLATLSSALSEIEAMTELLESTVSRGDDQRDYDSNTLIKANANMQQALKSLSTVTSDSATLAKFGSLSDYVLQVSSSVQTTSYSSDEAQTQALIIKSMKSSTQLLILPLLAQVADENPIQKVTTDYEVMARHVSTDKITQNHNSNLGTSIQFPSDILTSRYTEPSVFQIVYISKIIQYNFGFSNLLPKNTLSLTTSFYKPSGDSVTVDNLSSGNEVIMYMFKNNVTSYPINDTAFHYSSGYDPLLHMNYSSRTLSPDASFAVNVNMPTEAGVGIHIQLRGNFTRASAKLFATLYKNDIKFSETDSNTNKRPKTIDKAMMDDLKHDHTAYTFFISPSDYSTDDAFKVHLRVSESTQVLVGVYLTRCEFFNEGNEEWDNEGCLPHQDSIATCIKCACNHMTSFGGSLFVSPDELDFTDLSEVDFASNPVAIITCSVILGLYIILVVAFRKLDLMDLKRISLIPLCGKDGSFKYEVTIVTGRLPGAGTTAHVGIRLVGEYGKSARQHVIKSGAFKRNCSDTFIIAYDVNLGELKKIQIWHDNRGSSPSWYLSHVIVNDLQTDHKFYFFGNTWFSLEQENGTIQKELKVAGSNDMSKFSYRLKTAMFNSLADKHLWLSLFNRPAQSRFTRVQRVTCCVTILFTFVVVNAMWYGLLKKDNTELGLEGFGWEEVVLAMVSNIMVLPISIGLVYLFKKSRSKPNFFDHVHKPQTAQTLEIENLCGNSQSGSFESTNTGAIPYDLERESTIDSVPHTAAGLHRSRHVAKSQRENTDDSIIQKRPSVAVTKASSKSPLWNEDNIMKWPESVNYDDGADSRPSTASTMAAGPSVRQPPGKAGGSTPGASRKSKTLKKGDAGQLLDELDKLEHDLKESESRSVKSSGSKKSSTTLRRPTMHKSQWGSLEDILHSDDESVAESSAKMRKRGSTTSQSTIGKFNPRADPRISGNGGMWPESRESVMSRESGGRSGRGITSGLRPGYYSEMTMESRDIPVHKEKCSLPPWCIYIAYTLCTLLVIFSSIIVILYCFRFGYQESVKWVLALILSLVLSFLIIEPLKALLIAVYVVATFKKVEEDEDEDFIDIEPTFDNSNEKIKDVKFKPISGFALLQAKEEGRKIHRMNVMIRQFIAYVFYLWLIMVLVYVNFQYDTYLMTKHVENDFIAPTTNDHLNFTNITTIDEFWEWTETVFIDSLYKENNTQDEEHAFLLGEARMRLIRGVTAKCEAANAASNLGASSLTDRTCYGQGNYDEDTDDYAEGWNDSNSNYSWRHYSAGELGSTHKIGHVATYGGGGYPQGLGTTSAETDSIIAHLKDKGWIDLQTRAVIFEFALYSAGSDITSMVALLAEFPLTGGVITSYEIQSQKLLWFQKDTVEPLMVLECILFLVIIYSVIHLALQIREWGKQFFKDIWNWYEMLTTLMALVSVGMYIGCVVEATNTFNRFLDNQTGFTNYERAMYVHVGMRYLNAWLLFLLMFKVVKQMRFIKFMYVYERTLSSAVSHLLGTGLIYIILLLVYAQVGYLMYGRFVSGFESVGHSITTLIVMIRGSFDFWPMLDYQPVFSHFYVYSYYTFAYGIMIALVISILTSTYKVIKSQMYYKATLEMQDYEMVDFMLKRFKLLTGLQKPKPAFRRVRFPGLPSVSSRSSSSYSNRSAEPLPSEESVTGPQYSEVKLRSMMARLGPTWQAVLRRMDKIVALDDEEESLVKKADDEMKNLNWKCRINEIERQHKELLSWQNQPSTSDKPPLGDSKLRQSILKRPGASKDNQDRKAPATVSGAQIRTAASTPADDGNGAQGRRPLSDQGVRVEPASTSKRRASSNDKSKLQTFFRSIKPSKSAWNK
ncbi:polycystin-1-like isoform X3 [Ruditapes philippinarum]|uniref:polycystin-1-like isoform X3 n=1 Tax=Ruditapes philippinarum TaxID=129788 RepID=UPI00295A9D9C|nr:polycystin-1-like isoform X3 [Ruditapes philippinarum]